MRTLRDAMAPGSYLILSHAMSEGLPPETVAQGERLYTRTSNPVRLRSRAQIAAFFDGLELVEPGLVHTPLWRPEDQEDLFLDQPARSRHFAGVGRKP